MSEKDLLLGLLSKTLNKTPEELQELLYQKTGNNGDIALREEALDLLLSEEEKRIGKIKGDTKPSKEQLEGQYKRGIKEKAEEFENFIRKDQGFESDLTGKDLLKAYAEHIQKSVKTGLSDEKFRLDPRFIEAEKKWKAIMEDETGKIKTEFDHFKSGVEKNQKFSIVSRDIRKTFEGLKPVLSENPVVRENQINEFIDKFKGYDYDLADDNNHVISKEGKRLDGKLGYPVKFTEFVSEQAKSYFDFHKQEKKDGAAGTQGQAGGNITIPKSEQEYNKMINNAKTPQERIAVQDAWQASQK